MTIQASTRITRAPSDGQPGADAVSYRLQALPDAAQYTDGQYSPASISVSAYKRVGAAAEQIIALSSTTCEIGYQLVYADGSAAAMAWISNTTAGTIALADNADGSPVVRVDLRLYEHLADGSSANVARKTVPVVKTGVNGKDGISIVVSPQAVFFTKGKAAFAYVAVDIYDGGVLINQSKVGFSNLTTPSSAALVDGMLLWNGNLTDSGTRFRYQLAYGGNGDIDITVPFTVTYNGTAYNLSFSVKTVADGQSTYLSTVFRGYTPTTAAPTPSKPTGGSYAGTSSATAGLPEDGLWTDGIPDTDEPLWTSQRRFTSDGLSPQDAEWSDPILLADTPDFDVEYSDSIEQPEAPNGHPCTNTTDNGGPWTSTPSSSAVWMATSYRRNGKWSTWAVTRIKGENGTSIAVKGAAKAHYASISALNTEGSATYNINDLILLDADADGNAGPYRFAIRSRVQPTGSKYITYSGTYTLATVGDGYICAADGHLWMAADDGWQDCGQIKGDKGDTGQKGEDGQQGPQGYQGIIIRTTEWQEGKVYRNDDGFKLDSNNQPTEEVRAEEGTNRRYLDIVFITLDTADNANGYEAYVCTETHTSAASNKPGSGSEWADCWEQISSLTPIMTPLVVARLALVSYLQANTITADEIYMEGKDENGNDIVLFRAQGGEVVCNTGTFDNITATNITVNSGKIGGFRVSGNMLTNLYTGIDENGKAVDMYDSAYIIFRNDNKGWYAGFGGSQNALYSEAASLLRIENNEVHSGTDDLIPCNIAAQFTAQNATRNYAAYGIGNAVFNGFVAGFAYLKVTLASANTFYNGYLDLYKATTFIVNATASNTLLMLPQYYQVRTALRIGSGTAFCLAIRIMADLGTSEFDLLGRYNKVRGGSTNINTDEYPLLTHWNGGVWETLHMAEGDAVEIMLVYDPDRTATISGYPTKYTARIINRQD